MNNAQSISYLPPSSSEFHQTLALIADPKKKLIVDEKSGTIRETHLLRTLWEKLKGALGGKDWNNKQLLEFKVLDLLTHGSPWLKPSDLDAINSIAKRFIGQYKDLEKHSELSEIIQKLSQCTTRPISDDEGYELEEQEIAFYDKHRGVLKRYDIDTPVHQFHKVIFSIPSTNKTTKSPKTHKIIHPKEVEKTAVKKIAPKQEAKIDNAQTVVAVEDPLPAIYPQDLFSYLIKKTPKSMVNAEDDQRVVNLAYKHLMPKDYPLGATKPLDRWIKEKILEIGMGFDADEMSDIKALLNPETLINNIGLHNTTALLCRGYQLSQKLSTLGGREVRQKSEIAATLFKEALNRLLVLHPAEINFKSLTFNPQEVSKHFINELQSSVWSKVGQVFSAALVLLTGASAIASAFSRSALPTSPPPNTPTSSGSFPPSQNLAENVTTLPSLSEMHIVPLVLPQSLPIQQVLPQDEPVAKNTTLTLPHINPIDEVTSTEVHTEEEIKIPPQSTAENNSAGMGYLSQLAAAVSIPIIGGIGWMFKKMQANSSTSLPVDFQERLKDPLKPPPKDATLDEKQAFFNELRSTVTSMKAAGEEIIKRRMEELKGQVTDDIAKGRVVVNADNRDAVRKKYGQFFDLNDKEYEKLTPQEKIALEEGYNKILNDALLLQELKKLKNKTYDQNPYIDETNILKRYGYLTLPQEVQDELKQKITESLTAKNATQNPPLAASSLATAIDIEFYEQTLALQAEIVSQYCNSHDAEISALSILMQGEGIPPDAISELKQRINEIKLEARLKALGVPSEKIKEMQKSIMAMPKLRQALEKQAETLLQNEDFSYEGLVKKGISPLTSKHLAAEIQSMVLAEIDKFMKTITRSLKDKDIKPNLTESADNFGERLINSPKMKTFLDQFALDGFVAKKIQNSNKSQIAFYQKWQRNIKYDFDQSRFELGDTLGEGVCAGISTRWAIHSQKHPNEAASQIGTTSHTNNPGLLEISAYDRFHQAIHRMTPKAFEYYKEKTAKVGTSESKEVLDLIEKVFPMRLLPETVRKKLGIKNAVMKFNFMSETPITNISTILETYLTDNDVQIELKRSHGTLLLGLRGPSWGHATYFTFDQENHRFHFGDPNVGIAECDSEREFFEFINDLLQTFYDDTNVFDLIQLQSVVNPNPTS